MTNVRKNVTKALFVILSMVMIFAAAGIQSHAATKPTKMTVKSTSTTVDVKGHVKISVDSVTPENASKSVYFESSNKGVATVSSKGVVTGKKKGTVKITVTSKLNKKLKKSVKITVKNMTATGVTLNKSNLKLAKTWTQNLKATVKGNTGYYNPGVEWKSSNTKVATVSSKGVVTAKGAGTASITATVKGESKKATCKVTVVNSLKAGEKGLNFGNYTWSVLESKDGKAFLFADNVIEYRPYNKESTYVTWASSSIREYLNSSFIDKNFSSTEKSKIQETMVVNDDNAWYESEGGEDTVDKVFLLSVDEMIKYFGNDTTKEIYEKGDQDENVYMIKMDGMDESRIAVVDPSIEDPTADEDEYLSGPTWYFLRTPGYKNGRAVDVAEYGWIIMYGDCCIADWGIRPAMWVSVK